MQKYFLIIIISGLASAIYLTISPLPSTQTVYKTKHKTAFTPIELLRMEKLSKAKNNTPKFDQPNEYFNYHQQIRTREGHSRPGYGSTYKMQALDLAREKRKSAQLRTQALDWIERGPGNVPGRTRGLLVMPTDPSKNTWLAGSVGGGIWKTEDGGQSWQNKTPNFPSLSTVSLAHAASQPDIIYAGTGEAFSSSTSYITGDGIFKSLDGGETWSQLSVTKGNMDFANVNRIIVDPENPDLVLVCANSEGPVINLRYGIFRSVNGGVSWTKVYNGTDQVQQLIATPGNFEVMYATIRGIGVVKSIDAGLTWQDSSNDIQPAGRLELAIAPTKPDRVFASVEGEVSGNGSDLYLSDDAGTTWIIILEEEEGPNLDFLGGQGWYDNTIAVDPYDEDVVYYGGVRLFRKAIKPGTTVADAIKVEVAEINTSNFFDVANFNGPYFRGGLDLGDAPKGDFESVELRFGPGRSQLAHRFTIPLGQGSGVDPSDYTYQDYVTVPFEAWDVINNKQLMVSFRDQQNDGIFQLISNNTTEGDEPNHSREYIIIHAIDYNTTSNTNIANNGGHEHRQMYFIWPVLADGGQWNPNNLPSSKLEIDYQVDQVAQRLSFTTSLTGIYEQVIGTPNHVGLHPDHHNLIMIPLDTTAKTYKILNANDGGVYVSNISTTPGLGNGDWTFTGSGYNTSQFYGADKKRGEDAYIGGMQDNGTWRSPNGNSADATTNYLAQLGGDGFEVIWNYGNPDKIIGSIQFNRFWRTIDGGQTWIPAVTGLTGEAPFISRLANSNSNSDVLFTVSSTGVFKSVDFGETWQPRPISRNWGSPFSLNVEVSLADFNIVWAGSGMNNNLRLHVSSDGGETFSAVQNPSQNLGVISGLASHPTESATAYALFSFAKSPKILKTEDLGQTWTDISGFGTGTASNNGFPDVAVFTLLVMPHDPNTIWAGTEIGLFESNDAGQSWHFADNGLPAASIWQLKIVDDQVVVATHGRGIWSATIDELPDLAVLPAIEALGTGINGELVVDASLRSAYDSTLVFVNGNLVGKIGATTATDNLIKIEGFGTGESLEVTLHSYKNRVLLPSNLVSTELFPVNPVEEVYLNSFVDPGNDFIGNNFTITLTTGFNTAIQSTHSYEEGNGFPGGRTNYIYQLRTPIRITDNEATFSYRDVALIEPGEDGAPFGDADFFDYVVVEGSMDGINWQPISDGYDARFDADWLERYNEGGVGHQDLFVSHNVNLLETFAPGDTVFFRFRLFSDPFAAGWGWAIDDINIQGQVVTDIESPDLESAFQIYPNPVDTTASVRVELPKTETVSWQIIDMSGRLVSNFNYGLQPRGLRNYNLPIESLRPGVYIFNLQKGPDLFTRKLIVSNH